MGISKNLLRNPIITENMTIIIELAVIIVLLTVIILVANTRKLDGQNEENNKQREFLEHKEYRNREYLEHKEYTEWQ